MPRNDFATMKSTTAAALHDTTLVSRCGDWINETIQDLHKRSKFIYLHATGTLTTVADQQEYAFSSIASDIEKVLYIRDQDNDNPLREISYATLYDIVPDPESDTTSNPLNYYIKDETIGLYLTPSSVQSLPVDYKKRSVDLSADGDVPELPLEWTDIILMGAEARGLRYLKRTDWGQVQAFYDSETRRRISEERRPNLRFRFKKAQEEPNLFGPFFPRNF